MAVIGVDNNALLCDFCNPPLSSTQPNPQRVGYEAAMLFGRLMDSGRPGATAPNIFATPAQQQPTRHSATNNKSCHDKISHENDLLSHGVTKNVQSQ